MQLFESLTSKSCYLSSNTFRITELGCSIGPNTFSAMQHVVEALKEKYQNNIPEFQIKYSSMIISPMISTPSFDHYLLIDPTMHLEFQDLFMVDYFHRDQYILLIVLLLYIGYLRFQKSC